MAASTSEEAARAWLRERQGAGARYDSPAAPAEELLWARRGTAYFGRKLNELTDRDLDQASLVPGWSRRHVIAHIGYQARFLARLVEAARKGLAEEVVAEHDAQVEDIDLAATLPPHALRFLFKHSEVHLNVEWRDLSDAGWSANVRALNGSFVQIRSTPRLRAIEIWSGAINLDNGASPYDVPLDLRAAIENSALRRLQPTGR